MNSGQEIRATKERRCGECGREMAKAHKIHSGTAICQRCYQHLFKSRECTKCGGPVRAMAQDPSPICAACHRAARICLRCERPVPTAGLIFEGKPVCPSCAPYFREATSCPTCGKLSTTLSRVVGVTDEAVCDACRRALIGVTCSVCGKHRNRFAMTPDGKPLCKSCAANPDATHACPDCGKIVGGSSNAPCLSCGMIRAIHRKADALARMLQAGETRRLLEEYVKWVIERGSVRNAIDSLSSAVEVLGRIESADDYSDVLSPDIFERAMTTDQVRRSGVFAQFLAEKKLLVRSATERAAASDLRRVSNVLGEVQGKPWSKFIQGYVSELNAPNRKLSARSQRMYLRAAVELLVHSEVHRVIDLADDHIRRFLRSKPGHRASLFSLVSYIKEKHDHQLIIPPKQRKNAPSIKAVADEVRRLSVAARSVEALGARRAYVAKIISVLFGVPLEHILSLDQTSLSRSPDRTRLQIKGQWMDLEAPIDELLLGVAGESAKIFPGRLPTDSLSVSGAVYHIQNLDI